MKYDPSYLSPKIVEWTKKKIKEKFDLGEDESLRLAERALHGIESHGGNKEDKREIQRVVDVVVASWVKLREANKDE